MRKSPNYYLRNISRRWHAEIKKVDDNNKVIIICPYLTSKAEKILRGSNVECEVYTVFSVRNFVSGASSLKTLKNLYERGCKLYHLPEVHAKIIISPGKFATIGSQNVTRNGEKSKEATVIIFDKEEIKKIERMLETWLDKREDITSEMLKEVEGQIIRLRTKFRLINREFNIEINDLEKEIWGNQDERNKQLEREAEELKEAERVATILREIVKNARTKVQQLSTNGVIELELAEEFIKNCAYFKISTLARTNDVNQIRKEGNNWVIYQSNSFSISSAIYNCQQFLLEFLEKAESEYIMPETQVRKKLGLIVQESVINNKGDKYKRYNAISGDFIWFGSHSISISDFVNLILSKSNIDDHLFRFQRATNT